MKEKALVHANNTHHKKPSNFVLIRFITVDMANPKWDDLKAKIFFSLLAFLILGLLSLITGEDDPIDLIWSSFWAVVWVVGSISILAFIYISAKEMFKRK